MLAGAAVSPAQFKHVAVTLLTRDCITLPVETKAKVSDVLEAVCCKLAHDGMRSTQLFGLALQLDGERVFADSDKKLSKYASRAWRTSPTGLDSSGQPLLQFQFCVRYYVQTALILQDAVSRTHYYLQLRDNVLRYGQVWREDQAHHLAALALQADYADSGDSGRAHRPPPYFDPLLYYPQWVVEREGSSQVIAKVTALQQQHQRMTKEEAQEAFIEAASFDEAPHNVHLYHLRRKKSEPSSQVTLAVGDKGISIYEEEPGPNVPIRKLSCTYPWLTIDLVTFDKKKFSISSNDLAGKQTFYSSSDEKNRHMWLLCRLHHQHSKSVRPRVQRLLRHGPRLERRVTRNSSHYSRSSGMEFSSVETSASLDSINLLMDDRLTLPHAVRLAGHRASGSLDSLRNYLSSSPSSASSEPSQPPSADLPSALSCDLQEELPLSLSTPGSPECSRAATVGRVSSIHSSSSQQSASTVRSKYSMMRLQPELTLGAQLADLSLSPDLPDLADLPSMASRPINECDAVDGADNATQLHTAHNCCSTCCDDHDNDSDEDSDNEQTIASCHCGSCSVCGMRQAADEGLDSFPDSAFLPHGALLPSHLEHSNQAYRYTDNFMALENTDDYVEFYKSLSHGDTSLLDVNSEDPGNSLQDYPPHSSASDVEEQHLDYSVESAHEAFSGIYANRNYLNYDGCISPSLGSESDSGRYSMLHPAAVTMATITTSTPVSIASSRMGVPTSRSDSMRSDVSNADTGAPMVAIKEVQVANSSEAPAKLITSRHRITVLKAHTQETFSPAASHQAVPLTRGRGHTLPQVPPKQKPGSIQSLQRSAYPFSVTRQYALCPPCIPEINSHLEHKLEPALPVIRKNNYLDVRASSSISKNRTRMHPRQPSTVAQRSLYLRHQKKELLQQQLREKQERQLLEQQMSSETVYQPDAYAQGVGVPLQPAPTIAGYSQCSHHQLLGQSPISNRPSLPSASHHICQSYPSGLFHNQPLPPSNMVCDGSSCHFGTSCGYPSDPMVPHSGAYHYNAESPSYASSRLQPQHFASVYTNQVSLSQIEQYKAQLNSDVDYVIYPLKDPAISRQEYMDAKQSQVIANQTQQQQQQQLQFQLQRQLGVAKSTNQICRPSVPPYRSPKLNPLYRSTPNVTGQMTSSVISSYPSYLSLASHNSMHQPGSSSGYSSMARGRFFSQQSLSSSMSSTQSGYSASTQSLSGSYDPYGEIIMTTAPPSVMRVRSDESILSSALDDSEGLSVSSAPPHQRPPPPYRPKVTIHRKGVYRAAGEVSSHCRSCVSEGANLTFRSSQPCAPTSACDHHQQSASQRLLLQQYHYLQEQLRRGAKARSVPASRPNVPPQLPARYTEQQHTPCSAPQQLLPSRRPPHPPPPASACQRHLSS
ncbi:protein expanded isoform X2 [Hyalella azteca]|uniref:Protein expanded isoform X2 n=1 Tax=Hyalella azteca TaxID=294128 RepID=A0A979FVH9_HYAAZ|nr:protein expanded isoform X2 [Hyalella azteca]